MITEDLLNGLRLRHVPEGRRGAVNVDVVNVFRRQTCVVQGILHHVAGAKAFGVGRGDVMSVCRHATTDHFAVNLGATGLGMLEIFQNDGRAAFPKHEAITGRVERTRGLLGLIVSG